MNILVPVFVYTFLPYRLSWKVPSVFLMTLFEMWVLYVYKDPMPSGASFATIAAFATVNILGYLVARRFAVSDREYFLQYLNEVEAKEKYSAIVSRQELLVSELEKADAVKTRLFSIIGHDLHDTLKELLALRQNTSAEALEKLEEHIQSSREQIRNLLTWVKIQNNSLAYAPSAFDLKELLEEVMHRYAAEAARKKVSLSLTHAPIRTIVADREMLDQVFENLITNAVKYAPENGRIEVEIKREGLHLAVVVRNDGATLPDDLLQSFTEGSVPEGSSGLSGSRGLGLLLCRELVARNRGQFGIHTLPEGGTRAEVWLPQG
jgi:signal transduction histidine kinase